ncbi:hypothetical protein PPERSA_10184 [Pseudocohnilembus persalinus]|uniref:Uncharacterized protein n=1 Tax=Pseudocohnilembus persalinus TaxID=266149 RepID=A0A0V0QLB0_PSEPJ|nr:hypothetical protein PPERSA_10184 [Pseudocohnilembus persalinus]|eukprot:KRX03103.1 hypothetical protein PPERSA_10184 [Pseudocohnilembus persalinus]
MDINDSINSMLKGENYKDANLLFLTKKLKKIFKIQQTKLQALEQLIQEKDNKIKNQQNYIEQLENKIQNNFELMKQQINSSQNIQKKQNSLQYNQTSIEKQCNLPNNLDTFFCGFKDLNTVSVLNIDLSHENETIIGLQDIHIEPLQNLKQLEYLSLNFQQYYTNRNLE